MSQKGSESLVEDILKQLEKNEMGSPKNCLSQWYDNTTVVAPPRSGVGQIISEKNNFWEIVTISRSTKTSEKLKNVTASDC